MNKIFLLAILPFLVVIPADADHESNDYHFECYVFYQQGMYCYDALLDNSYYGYKLLCEQRQCTEYVFIGSYDDRN